MGVSFNDVLLKRGVNIIDIRDNYNYNLKHLMGAVNIPYYKLLGNYSRFLDKNKKYYLYCDYGTQSKEISNRLNLFGYNTESINEGYLSYLNKGH